MSYAIAYLTVFAVALAASLIGTPVARRLARRFGVLDQPSSRKVHRNPTPLLGGLAVYAGFWLSVIAATRIDLGSPDVFLPAITFELIAIFTATLPLVVVGFFDDKYKTEGVSPRIKLAAQFVSAGIVSLAGLELRVFDTLWLDLPLTCLWIVGITNAINLLDNMDGLSAGATAIAAFSFFTIAAMNGQILVGSLAIALAGACLGFLRYNFKPASVFMGDTGTLFMGFLLATIGMKLKATGPTWWSFVIAIAVLALPIFDTSLVTIDRIWKGQAVSHGGKDHTSHRLVKLGLPQKEAVLLLYAAGAVAGATALALARGGLESGLVVGVPVIACALGAGFFLARVDV